jgi:3-deoxy-7-phosphoheptulonate synthase
MKHISPSGVHNVNIVVGRELFSPDELKAQYPLSERGADTIRSARRDIANILTGKDERLFVVVGPCSIHRVAEAHDYAHRLAKVAEKVSSTMVLVMRTYFEKPRTVGGWKGFINDPHLDGTFAIQEGLALARQLLVDVSEMGLPAATEMLDLISPQYLADCISWSAIGARTTESQTHRQLASGLSMPVGFKNGTSGDIEIAANAVMAAAQSHHFLSVSDEGQVSVFQTKGNPNGHIILRGGYQPNYEEESVEESVTILRDKGLCPIVMVDCSHGNSRKDFRNQPKLFRYALERVGLPNYPVRAFMIESNIQPGNQVLTTGEHLTYGVSITDGCIGWDETEELLMEAHERLKHPHRS